MRKDKEKIKEKKEMHKKLVKYDMKRWQENRGKFVEFDIKTMNKYKVFYDDMLKINPDGLDGMGVEQLKEPFISLGLAYSKDEVTNLILSVDDDLSGRIEFNEFLRIIHNKSKKKSKGNEKITNFFKKLAKNQVSKDLDLNYFSFKTVMKILRRENLLKAFMSEDDSEKKEANKILDAYCELVEEMKVTTLQQNISKNEGL